MFKIHNTQESEQKPHVFQTHYLRNLRGKNNGERNAALTDEISDSTFDITLGLYNYTG